MAQTPVCPEPANVSRMRLQVLEYADIFSAKASGSLADVLIRSRQYSCGMIHHTPCRRSKVNTCLLFHSCQTANMNKTFFFVILACINYSVMLCDKPARCNYAEPVFTFNVTGFMPPCLVQGTTHIMHFFLQVSIPIFFILFTSPCGLFLMDRKL